MSHDLVAVCRAAPPLVKNIFGPITSAVVLLWVLPFLLQVRSFWLMPNSASSLEEAVRNTPGQSDLMGHRWLMSSVRKSVNNVQNWVLQTLAGVSDADIIQAPISLWYLMRQFSHQGLFGSFYLVSLFLAALHFPLPSPLFSQNKQN